MLTNTDPSNAVAVTPSATLTDSADGQHASLSQICHQNIFYST